MAGRGKSEEAAAHLEQALDLAKTGGGEDLVAIIERELTELKENGGSVVDR